MYLSIEKWSEEIVHPNDVPIRNNMTGHYSYVVGKYDICCRVKPKIIIEIGVRLGYSAHAFLYSSPNSQYHGLDIWGGKHGGTKIGGEKYVMEMLSRNFTNAKIKLYTCNTQKGKWPELPADVDLFHIDGDHTTAGSFFDMAMAFTRMKRGAYLLVDDYDFLPDVRIGVDSFISAFSSLISDYKYFPTFRGDVLITRA